jgi:hypothetical protein
VCLLAWIATPLLQRINEKLLSVPLTSTRILFPNEPTNEKGLLTFQNKPLEALGVSVLSRLGILLQEQQSSDK